MSLGGGILHTGGYLLYFVGAEGELRIENWELRIENGKLKIENYSSPKLGEVVRSTREVCLRAERARKSKKGRKSRKGQEEQEEQEGTGRTNR